MKFQDSTFKGQCHCGALSFQFQPEKIELIECNCSICTMKGFIHLIVAKERFHLLSGTEQLQTYTFHTGVAIHKFCKICGIHPFYTPRSHPDCIDVNANCIDGFSVQDYEIRTFDGQNWEAKIETLLGSGTVNRHDEGLT